ncbi:hypothetical protein [Zooshikella ganghwensis]|uniref:hypothetical protein n=1 Tax=Zooshikella ganghwensis TaxID=202772 RepID=UPI0013FDE797
MGKGRGLKILQGKCVDVAAGMRRRATVEGLSQDCRKAVYVCKTICKNIEII